MTRTEAGEEQLERNAGPVRWVVDRVLRRYSVGDMEREDLISWGMMGLLEAARRWDPERSCSFSTLASMVIESRVLRGVNRQGKPAQAAATLSLDALILEEEAGGQAARLVDQLASEQDVERQVLDSETRTVVRSALAQLPPPQRRLIERHFYEDTPIPKLAEEMGLTRQAVHAREKKILQQLRDLLSPTCASTPAA